MRELSGEADILAAMRDSVEVQYMYDEQRGREFNHLSTKTAGVIGSRAAIDRQRERIQLMISSSTPPDLFG